jgi:CHASE3 domain sensor protein
LKSQKTLSERWVTHTHQVLSAIEAVSSELKDAETGQRGYLLTSKEAYLEPYLSALSNVPVRLHELERLGLSYFLKERCNP